MLHVCAFVSARERIAGEFEASPRRLSMSFRVSNANKHKVTFYLKQEDVNFGNIIALFHVAFQRFSLVASFWKVGLDSVSTSKS